MLNPQWSTPKGSRADNENEVAMSNGQCYDLNGRKINGQSNNGIIIKKGKKIKK
jgi:hypothetical protein